MSGDRVLLFGIPIDRLDMEETVAKAFDLIDAYAKDGMSRYCATANVDFLTNVYGWHWDTLRHPELLAALESAELITADGMPLIWWSRWIGSPLPERVAGADLLWHLVGRAATAGKSIYLLGGTPDTAHAAIDEFRRRYPHLRVAGVATPRIAESDVATANDADIVAAINVASPDLLFINLGNPKQEIWFARNRHRLQVPLSIGIGGALAFVARKVSRAPSWMQRNGLEWVYRLIQEPRRLARRYLVGGLKFATMVLPAALYGLRTNRPSPTPGHCFTLQAVDDEAVPTMTLLRLPEALSKENKIPSASVLDASQVRFVDGEGLAALYRWSQCQPQGRIIGISTRLRRILRMHRCWRFLARYHVEDSPNYLKAIASSVQSSSLKQYR